MYRVDNSLADETRKLLRFEVVEKRNNSAASLFVVFYREDPSAISASYSNRRCASGSIFGILKFINPVFCFVLFFCVTNISER